MQMSHIRNISVTASAAALIFLAGITIGQNYPPNRLMTINMKGDHGGFNIDYISNSAITVNCNNNMTNPGTKNGAPPLPISMLSKF